MEKKNYILLAVLIFFSIYCAIIVGESWDERYELLRGKVTLDYFFSLGKINNYITLREDNSTLYYTLSFFITQMFPYKYQIEVSHLINLFFSLAGIFGIGKIGKELFNKKVGYITFLILFFLPSFFGHMAFNSKDTIIAFSHIWIFYLLVRYIKKQTKNNKSFKYILGAAVLTSLATGIKLVFIGALLPIILFIFLETFFIKKITNVNFSRKKFIFDLILGFVVFYFILLLFWIDTHPNIYKLPVNFFLEIFSSRRFMGWPFNLLNGEYFISREVPSSYILTNLFYKLPEYILFSYFLFIVFFIVFKKFFSKNFKHFQYKISLIILILIFPNLILVLTSLPAYDGLRLFLWFVPYICFIPALVIYYFYKNFKYLHSKVLSFLMFILIGYFMINFFSITPYQYTYLNIFNGKKEMRFKKFENDYWGVSLKELLKNPNLENNKLHKVATCGVNIETVKMYLRKNNYSNLEFVHSNDAEYMIMTNRVVHSDNDPKKLINCFEKFPGKNLSEVKANGLTLSVIRVLN